MPFKYYPAAGRFKVGGKGIDAGWEVIWAGTAVLHIS